MPVPDQLTAALAGHYDVQREIGAGGMATVYLARDVRHDRLVAIKVLREDLSASLGKERFLREIKVAAALQHPHVLPLYDSGDANGLLYYVMPYVEGQSLREKIVKEGELPVADAARILRDVADAISEAHKQGIVHRDLKPENVMLRGRHSLVTDFGVAKALSEATGRQSLTTVGVALGTPTYMAPEQAVADPHVDHRADIYAFGVVAYELLAGRPPFTGMTPQQVLAAHVTSAAEPVTTHRTTIPPVLAALVMRCLEKKPADRVQSADELVMTLETVLTPSGGMTPTDTRPLTAAAAPAPARTLRPAVMRNVGIAAGVVVVALGAWLWKGRAGGAAASDRSIAVLPFEDISGDTANRAFILGMHGEIVTQMTKLPGVQVASRQATAAYADSHESTMQIAKELGVARVLTGTLQRAGGQIHVQVELQSAENGRPVWADSYNEELTTANLFAIQAEVAKAVASAIGVTITDANAAAIAKAPTASLPALDLYHRTELLWIERGSPQRDSLALTLIMQAVKLDSSFAEAWAYLAMERSWFLRNGVDVDTMLAQRALDRAGALKPAGLQTRVASGYYRYYAHADYQGALKAYQAALELEPSSTDLVLAVAFIYRRLNRFDEGLAEVQRAAKVDAHSFPALYNLSSFYLDAGRWAEAAKAAQDALVLNPGSSSAMGYLAFAHFGTNDTAFVVDLLRRQRSQMGPDAAAVDVELALRRGDPRAAIPVARSSQFGWAGPDANVTGDPQLGRLTDVAVLCRLAADPTCARVYGDSAVQLGQALRRPAARRSGDPFGLVAAIDIMSATALAAKGDSARAVALAAAALARYNETVDGSDGKFMRRWGAIAYTLVNRPHDAVEQLRIAVTPSIMVSPAELRTSLLWEPLRNNAEFKAFLASLPTK